jgi:hypothetical protein
MKYFYISCDEEWLMACEEEFEACEVIERYSDEKGVAGFIEEISEKEYIRLRDEEGLEER